MPSDADMRVAVILPAAGASRRFRESDGASGGGGKLERPIAGKPVFLHAVEAFSGRAEVAQILVAVRPDDVEGFRFKWGDRLGLLGAEVIAGGERERWQTVTRALSRCREDATHVAVHDAARPMVSSTLIDRVFMAGRVHPAVIPGAPVADTLKRVEMVEAAASKDPLDALLGGGGEETEGGAARRVVETVDRSTLVAVQTPQLFERSLLLRAYQPLLDAEAGRGGDAASLAAVTDDARLVEMLGEAVHVVEGDPQNLKITRPEDLAYADWMMQRRQGESAASLGARRLFGDDEDD